MDPGSLATAAMGLLLPHLKNAGEKAVEKLGEKLPDAVGKLWTAIFEKFKGKDTEEAVGELVAQPEDQQVQTAVTYQLKKALEKDSTFLSELEQLLKVAKETSGTIINTGSGAVATGGGVAAGEGGVAVQGDVHGGIHLGGSKK